MENTAKNFALQLGSIVSLYVSITALITLLFGLTTIQFPDVANGYWEQEGASSSIRFGIAMLVVFFPTYVALTRMVNTIRRKEGGVYLTLTKWVIYLSLLIGGGIILGDLVAIILAFLNGELTVRFLLKALVFLVVVGGAFIYYLFDARGYWHTHEKESIRYGVITGVIVLISIVVGFTRIETPQEVREMHIDDVQVQDLMSIQSHIEAYVYTHASFPQSIDIAYEGITAPTAPEGRETYMYTITGDTTYELCAEFARESLPNGRYNDVYYTDPSMVKNVVNWDHGTGVWCYKRTLVTDTNSLTR